MPSDGTALAVGVLAVSLGCVIVFPPGANGIYPPCPFWFLTGWKCPGCGTLRALRAISEGSVILAWSLNPALVVFTGGLLPYAVIRLVRPSLAMRLTLPAGLHPVIPLLVVIFWIGRNL